MIIDQRTISDAEQQEIEDFLSLDPDLLYSLVPTFMTQYRGTSFVTEGHIDRRKADL